MTIILISELLERHSKVHHCTSLFTSARRIKGVVQGVVHGKLKSDFQRVRVERVAVKVGVVSIGRLDDQMNQGKSF